MIRLIGVPKSLNQSVRVDQEKADRKVGFFVSNAIR